MTKRLGYALVCAVVAGTFGLSACSDDDSGGSDGTAGSAGTQTGGSSSGGSSNKAGNGSGGTATAGTGTAGAAEGGAAGAGGATDGGAGGASQGGAGNDAGAAGTDAGAGGAGGAGTLTYACGSDTLPKKLCSAFVAADCTDPTVCADCVTERTAERDDFYQADSADPCATCTDKFDAYFQCVVDAFEGGNISEGVECLDGYGADIHFENCVPLLDEASACHTYLNENACPSTWPPT